MLWRTVRAALAARVLRSLRRPGAASCTPPRAAAQPGLTSWEAAYVPWAAERPVWAHRPPAAPLLPRPALLPPGYGCAHPLRDVVAVPVEPRDAVWLQTTGRMSVDKLMAEKKR